MKKGIAIRKIIWMWIFVFMGICLKYEDVAAFTYDPRTCFYLSTVHEPVMGETIGDENVCNINNGVYVCKRNTGMLYDGDVYANVIFYEKPTTFSLKITDTAGAVLKDIKILNTDSNWYHIKKDGNDKYIYTLQIPFKEKQRFDIQMEVLQSDMPSEKVRYEIVTLQYEFTSGPEVAVGFTEELTTAGASDMNLAVAKWTSSNSSVATVNSKGVVKGKKIGKSVITAHFANGTTASKTVKVIPNEYTKAKLKKKDVKKGDCQLGVHSIYYDKAGNLIIKANLINRTSDKILYFEDISIKIWDGKGKVIGTYSLKKYGKYRKYYSYFLGSRMGGPYKKYDFSSNQVKTLTLKIPKAKLKQKKALLTEVSRIRISTPYHRIVINDWTKVK